MNKLGFFIEKDPRIKEVYDFAKAKYLATPNRPQHNWPHVLRDLYRALVIAETENNVNYSILIPAIILHDIGVTEGEYKDHEENGGLIAKRELPRIGFNEVETDKIAYAISKHKGKERVNGIEAQIVFDADRLEKSGIAGIFGSYLAQYEMGKSLKEWAFPRKYNNDDLYTEKAKEVSGNGFMEFDDHFISVQKGIIERPDWVIEEKDLW
jgi:HD superfamily phosphodiesterase